ncbi:MAG: ArsR/SmtB family transcription factor [Aggregatilineales bacterium]
MTDYATTASKLKAMAHPVRLQILDLLRGGEICVCHIERALERRQAYISQQLMIMRDANLVTSRKDGLQAYYRLADERIVDLLYLLCGPPRPEGIDLLAGCRCPACSTSFVTNTYHVGETI